MTDHTRPVRDQDPANALQALCAAGTTAYITVSRRHAARVAADALAAVAAVAERDALRAAVDRVRALRWEPGNHQFVPTDDLRRALDGATQAAPRPGLLHPICDGCDVRESWEHRCHGEPCPCIDCQGGRRIFDPAAQGVPLTEDPACICPSDMCVEECQVCERMDGELPCPAEPLTEDPQR